MNEPQSPLAPLSQSAIVPPLALPADVLDALPVERPAERLSCWPRLALVLIALGLVTVLGIARWLNPYDENGEARQMGTHRQLGLPPCTFHWVTGLPCPSCGMTTSFSHLAHGDVWNSLRANPMGTMLAFGCLGAIPWCLLSAVWGRRLGVRDFEMFVARGMLALFIILMVTWGIRLLVLWAMGAMPKPV
jgi:hypothetical protein